MMQIDDGQWDSETERGTDTGGQLELEISQNTSKKSRTSPPQRGVSLVPGLDNDRWRMASKMEAWYNGYTAFLGTKRLHYPTPRTLPSRTYRCVLALTPPPHHRLLSPSRYSFLNARPLCRPPFGGDTWLWYLRSPHQFDDFPHFIPALKPSVTSGMLEVVTGYRCSSTMRGSTER